jgi:hypothetical protein
LLFSVFLDTGFPLADLLVVELTEVFDEGIVQFLDVLVLLTLLDRGRELTEAVKWVGDTLVETLGPVESTSNWGSIAGDG